jgi:Xaa-Pro aminopeptidase
MFPPATFTARREALRRRLGSGLVLIPGHGESPMNYRDNAYPFRQDSSFLYLFGLDQPDLVGLLDLDTGEDCLFGNDPSLLDVVWTGPLPTVAERAAEVGISRTAPFAALAPRLAAAQAQGRSIHYLAPFRGETVVMLAELLGRAPAAVTAGWSPELTAALVALRECKAPEEVAEIEGALALTARMHQAAFRTTRPGVIEREVVGAMEGLMRAQDRQLAYPVIFSKRGEVLHNHHHDLKLEAGDLVVNDTGCSSRYGYASDITRTLPVGGRFSALQRELYDVVLAAQEAVLAALRPGVPHLEMHQLACRHLVEGMKAHGCFNGDPAEVVASGAYAIVFQCGLGHAMGLDVHDMEGLGEDLVGYGEGFTRSPLFGLRSLRLAKPLKAGMVITTEPGLYFIPHQLDQWRAEGRFKDFIDYDALERFRHFGGIRIEDDVLITDTGSRVLGPPIPKTAEAVEAAMA